MTKAARDYLPKVAQLTEGYSGSDLKEVCRAAAWEPVRELTTGASKRAVGCAGSGNGNGNGTAAAAKTPKLKRTSSGFPPRGTKARPVNENDFLLAVQKVKKTGESAREFHKKEFLRGRKERASMAADISRAGANKNNSSGVKKTISNTNGDNNVQDGQMTNVVDMQQIMAMAMAAAASMNSIDDSANGIGMNGSTPDIPINGDINEINDDDDSVPKMLENESE